MRQKLIIIIVITMFLTFFSGITYSIFHSQTTLNSNNRNIAKFIFNAEILDYLEIPLIDINPGDTKEYLFSVTNKDEDKISEVTVEYVITIKTYHLVPLDIELYKINEDEEKLIMVCDESYTRNDDNELICNSEPRELLHHDEKLDNYKLKISFPEDYSDEMYSNLVDFIDLEIKSWQKIEE
ncbi:MAG: hypothetical protein GX190_03755 [Mollicutes bacterium]|nr:hypothetical protein [Mollicutes bacterium]